MTKNEALKMAIAEIEGWIDHAYGHTPEECADNKTIQACKEALEQPQIQMNKTLECPASLHGMKLEQPLTRDWKETIDERIAKDDAFKQALEQPAQEPVGWMNSEGRFRLDFKTEIVRSIAAVNKEIPLYTQPTPSWQGLSDDEKLAIIRKWKDAHTMREQELIGLGDAFEQALKEKNT